MYALYQVREGSVPWKHCTPWSIDVHRWSHEARDDVAGEDAVRRCVGDWCPRDRYRSLSHGNESDL